MRTDYGALNMTAHIDLESHLHRVIDLFQHRFGSKPEMVARAPGRVNLIGEHTDYNEGFVFPAAINREMLIAASPLAGDTVEVYSLEYDQADAFSLREIGENSERPWANYLRGTVKILQDAGYRVGGFKAVLSGNVPQGAGLSSSAAYEVATAALVSRLNRLEIEPKSAALFAQKAENDFIGVQCGIMDQFVSALGKRDCALLIDCRSLDYRAVPLNLQQHGACIVITNSGVRRGLVDSEYNARRAECKTGVELLSKHLRRRLNSLRDVSIEELDECKQNLPPVVVKRCRHVVSENARVIQAEQCLKDGNLSSFGRLMNESHTSLQFDFEVSCRELDALVELTQAQSGVYGARMTGAGFGGCTVALMDASVVQSFTEEVIPQYQRRTNKEASIYVCSAVDGAEVINL
jgi:galactokinase